MGASGRLEVDSEDFFGIRQSGWSGRHAELLARRPACFLRKPQHLRTSLQAFAEELAAIPPQIYRQQAVNQDVYQQETSAEIESPGTAKKLPVSERKRIFENTWTESSF